MPQFFLAVPFRPGTRTPIPERPMAYPPKRWTVVRLPNRPSSTKRPRRRGRPTQPLMCLTAVHPPNRRPVPPQVSLHVLMLPDFDRADRIGEFWGNPKTRTFAELLIDCEEDRTTRATR